MKGGRGSGAYLQELESLEAVAGDDINILVAAPLAVVSQ